MVVCFVCVFGCLLVGGLFDVWLWVFGILIDWIMLLRGVDCWFICLVCWLVLLVLFVIVIDCLTVALFWLFGFGVGLFVWVCI